MSTGTPAREASYSASMQRASTSEFIFITMQASWPLLCASIVFSISSRIRSRVIEGDTTAFLNSLGLA